MCSGVEFEYQGDVLKSYFPNPYAKLPVRKKDGSIILMPWGRREKQDGHLPRGGWARLDAIYAGKWDKYFPRPVKIPVLRYMEKDYEGKSHWYELLKRDCIQGLLAREGNELRVYVVTIEAEYQDLDYHERSPRIVDDMPKAHTII